MNQVHQQDQLLNQQQTVNEYFAKEYINFKENKYRRDISTVSFFGSEINQTEVNKFSCFLARFHKLQFIDLGMCRLNDETAERIIGNLLYVESINLSRNQIRNKCIAELSALKNLTSLNLSFNNLTDKDTEALGTLKNLTSLDLSFNQLTGKTIAALGNLKFVLKSLDLSYNEITDKDIPALIKFNKLTSLALGGNNITNEATKILINFKSLISLNLRYNRIAHISALTFINFDYLTILDLSNNAMTNNGIAALSILKKLTSLDLSFNKLTDKDISGLRTLNGLTSLNLCYNNITDKGVETFINLAGLTFLDLSYNRITAIGATTVVSYFDVLEELALNYNYINYRKINHLIQIFQGRLFIEYQNNPILISIENLITKTQENYVNIKPALELCYRKFSCFLAQDFFKNEIKHKNIEIMPSLVTNMNMMESHMFGDNNYLSEMMKFKDIVVFTSELVNGMTQVNLPEKYRNNNYLAASFIFPTLAESVNGIMYPQTNYEFFLVKSQQETNMEEEPNLTKKVKI
jgi:Leucine-rich repeat (LRR) protein